ncbi:MAG TPA: hypothetical protein VJM33_13425 [Microthrixaceae bacterium]|nr:hypothetical protein [Microthrixaceae bacterium]
MTLRLDDLIDDRFPIDDEWVRAARASLGPVSSDGRVRDVARGWLQTGTGDAGAVRLVDMLFVLTSEHLGFGRTDDVVAPEWLDLSRVVALDALEGLPHPLMSVEVQLTDGSTLLVGWTDEFCELVVELLVAMRDANDDSDRMPPELADPSVVAAVEDPSTIDSLSPSTWVESPVEGGPSPASEPEARPDPFSPPAEPDSWFSIDPAPFTVDAQVESPTEVGPPLDTFAPVADEPDHTIDTADHPIDTADHPIDPSIEAASDPIMGRTDEFVEDPWAATSESSELHEERLEAFFAPVFDDEPLVSGPSPDPEPPPADHVVPAAFANRSLVWPEPFRGVTFLGGHPEHQRRRKNVTLQLTPAGVAAVSSGFNSWKLHVPWDEVVDIEFEGPDEVKFTHNEKISMNGSAMIVSFADETSMVFEIRGQRPSTLRSALAPILSAVRTHRANLGFAASGGDLDEPYNF